KPSSNEPPTVPLTDGKTRLEKIDDASHNLWKSVSSSLSSVKKMMKENTITDKDKAGILKKVTDSRAILTRTLLEEKRSGTIKPDRIIDNLRGFNSNVK